jgi:AcrR family transcriptional regulator
MTRADRRQQILSRAREVFAKRGYHAAKIDDIVTAANIARGTFYLYFSDKRAIFEELVDRFFTRIGMSIQRVDPHDPHRTVEEQILANIRHVLNVLLDDRLMTKILMAHAGGADTAFEAKQMSFYDELGRMFIASLVDGQKLGLVRDGDVRLFAYFTIGGIKEMIYQIVTREWDYELEPTVDSIYDILQEGFLVRSMTQVSRPSPPTDPDAPPAPDQTVSFNEPPPKPIPKPTEEAPAASPKQNTPKPAAVGKLKSSSGAPSPRTMPAPSSPTPKTSRRKRS